MADLTSDLRRSDRDHPAFALLAYNQSPLPIVDSTTRMTYQGADHC
jgi:hypothetical protein